MAHVQTKHTKKYAILIAQFQRRDCKTSVEKADDSIQTAFETEQLGYKKICQPN